MTRTGEVLREEITLNGAKRLIGTLAHEQAVLLLAPPGVGKSEVVVAAAREHGLETRSLLGTQIAPEDVSGVPRIVGERSVFCPPRILLPESAEPFCLFLDELPACAPDIQKAFYSLLLDRRIGEHVLPPGTWVVAAGNRLEDRALVRAMSSALCNRVAMLHVRADVKEWLVWAEANGVRAEVRAFIHFMPEALVRPIPAGPEPFSTPRSWTLLARALDLCDQSPSVSESDRRALVYGRLTAQDAAVFCAFSQQLLGEAVSVTDYVRRPTSLPSDPAALWLALCRVRTAVARGELRGVDPGVVNYFLALLPAEQRFALLVGQVPQWGALGAQDALLDAFREAIAG